jgi:hypothetical protein
MHGEGIINQYMVLHGSTIPHREKEITFILIQNTLEDSRVISLLAFER